MEQSVMVALEDLRGNRDRHYELVEYTSGTKSGGHYAMDFLTIAVLNRSLALTRGFCDLIESQNFLAAVPLIRLQLDSCLRYSAAWYAPNLTEVADKIFRGAQVKDLRDRDGRRMYDRYLVAKLAEKYPWVTGIYDNTSGFIHLSDKHIFNAAHTGSKDERLVWFKVSDEDAFVPQWAYLEAIESFKKITVVLLGLVMAWGRLKKDYRKEQTDQETWTR